jgi:hypothetical protein
MKPDKRECLYCGKDITDKRLSAKFCKDAHRKAFERNSDNPVKRTNVIKADKLRDSLTNTDKTFYDRAMNEWGEPYYYFDGELREGVCRLCEKKFTTNLSLNRYCSYEHYNKDLAGKS